MTNVTHGVLEGEFFHPTRDEAATHKWVFWDEALKPAVKIGNAVFDMSDGMEEVTYE